jgi:hypothetical protein
LYLIFQFLDQFFKANNMFNNTIRKLQKPVSVIMILSVLLISVPKQTFAILGAGDTVVVVGDVSPTGITNFVNHTLIKLKEFVLDKMATMLMKQILHQMTMEVVNWINGGFQGSPAFLTNPGAFFLEAADQVTGAFLATNGPLSSLCSPFAIDIRLSLALSKTSMLNQRYTCTLGKIIQAQKNGPDIIVNGQVVRSSQGSMNGFLRGDFNQGGWPAFIALTTEPKNNPYGAFLSAEADLNARINAKQATIRADIQLGQGFMSWQKCSDIPGGTVDAEDDYQVNTVESMVGVDPSINRKVNKDGTITYQSCETQTPGSVIAGTLQTHLNVPVVELELADDINAIINALFTKMTSTIISGGLGALSGNSGAGPSYTQQVIDEIGTAQVDQGTLDNLQNDIGPAIQKIDSYVSIYKKAIEVLSETKNKFMVARKCFSDKSASEYAGNKLSEIDLIINSDINTSIASIEASIASAMADRKKLEDMSLTLAGTGSPKKVQAQAERYSQFVQSGGLDIQSKIQVAETMLENAQKKAKDLDMKATLLQLECYRMVTP